VELDFTADQDELRDAIRTVLAKEAPIALARAVVEGTGSADGFAATVTDLGWPALSIPEEYGGIGLGAVEVGLLAEELGRVVAPGALLATVSQFVPIVRELGDGEQRSRFLSAVASGEARGTVAIAERQGSFDPQSVQATATRTARGVECAGAKRFVMSGDIVDEIACVLRVDGELAVVVVPADAVSARVMPALDASRALVDIELDGVTVPVDRLLAGRDATGLQRALDEATVALALEMVGTAQSIFDVTLEYAKQREQFGVPIGSFQAVKHKFANMSVALERARATGYFAALTLAERDARSASATSVAKVAAGDCERLLAKEGIQLHGGIGYTWEHDMHLYTKRVKSGEPLFGTSAFHRSRLATLLGV
jgi:alkylation response protein AidB-like acyl-CoA dehydrogenase